MKQSLTAAALAMASLFASYAPQASATLPLVPLPAQVTETHRQAFATHRPMAVSVGADLDERMVWMANNFARSLTHQNAADIDARACLSLTSNPVLPAEAYNLHVSPDTISIVASSPAGFFYAMQTLRQLHETSADGSIPTVDISDAPRMQWRGFMLDEGRHIFGKEQVKRVIDLMALYKFNRLHWHLTEDQGWRIEIKKWPDLTAKGAWRDSEQLGTRKFKPTPSAEPYGGFYTQDDIREIVAYARDRFIEIVPEIDMPGHTQAMVAAYPRLLACDPGAKHAVWNMGGVSDDVINVAAPEAVAMARDIIDELIELFPYEYIHLGGDECPTTKWEKNKACRKRLKAIGSDNYRDLQLDFYRNLQHHIDAKPADQRRKLIFWNEVIHGNTSMLSDSITIMSWIGTEEAERDGRIAASRGYDVIMTPQIPYYINRRQSTDPREPLTQGEGRETLYKVYSYLPLNGVEAQLLPRYKGIQANFWSEFVPDAATLEWMMLPRLTAVAEAAWTPAYLRDYNDYVKRLRGHEPIYRRNGYRYAPYAFE